LPQIENGVGMVPFFMNKAMKINVSQLKTKNRFVTFTGYSFYPYLFQFIERFKRKNIFIDVYPLENNLFGETVTVTGLLTGEDIIKGLASYIEPRDCLLIPDVTMKDTEDVFIDDLTVKDIENVLKVKTVKIGTEPEDLFFAIKKLCD